MYIWPSKKLRDAFKCDYLNVLEWNLNQMKLDKQQKQQNQSNSNNQEKLLESDDPEENYSVCRKIGLICREFFMVLSCCYCCFCCGACVDDDEDDKLDWS